MKTRIFYGWIVVATLFVINFGTQAAGTLNLGLFAIPMGTDMGFSRGVFGWLTASRALAASLSLMLFPLSTSHMLVSVVLFGLSVGINIVSQTYLWASYYGRTFLGAIRGITLPLILLGSAMGAPVVGYIYDYTGSYELAWQLLIGTSLAALLVMLLATPPKRKTQ